jgi:molybdate transport repressor ModE-like protein
MKTGAVIVAAGHGKTDTDFRPMLPAGDSTVIRRIIITLKRAAVDPIVVITGRQGDELEKHISNLRVICLRNRQYEATQMFYSICLGLNYIEDLCDRVLILPAKFPMFLPETVKRLLESEKEIAGPVYDGRGGHPVLVSTKRIGDILGYRGDGGLKGFLSQEPVLKEMDKIPVEDEGIILSLEHSEDSARKEVERLRVDIHPKSYLEFGRNECFFDPSMAHFLTLIGHTGSMQTACRQMHMSYTKGWKLIKAAEKQLGYPLLVTRAGGADGGFSQLTPKGEDFLNRYLMMEEALRMETERLFERYFGKNEKIEVKN